MLHESFILYQSSSFLASSKLLFVLLWAAFLYFELYISVRVSRSATARVCFPAIFSCCCLLGCSGYINRASSLIGVIHFLLLTYTNAFVQPADVQSDYLYPSHPRCTKFRAQQSQMVLYLISCGWLCQKKILLANLYFYSMLITLFYNNWNDWPFEKRFLLVFPLWEVLWALQRKGVILFQVYIWPSLDQANWQYNSNFFGIYKSPNPVQDVSNRGS